jgi:hypothetical protein
MSHSILLSIVTPTRGNFTDYWLEQLLRIQGTAAEIEFVLVYPPGVPQRSIADPRVKSLTSPFKGEMIQRFTAFLNAQGRYILAVDDDDFVHPDLFQLVKTYFQQFPDDLVLRLLGESLLHTEEEKIKTEWEPLPALDTLTIVDKRREEEDRYRTLQTIPFLPLYKPFNFRFLYWPWTKRRDHYGAHIENFNLKVWDNQVVQSVLPQLAQAVRVLGPIVWLPPCGFDRLMGLFLQAQLFEHHQDKPIIGHWMPLPVQYRYISYPLSTKTPRFHFLSDGLLALWFPKSGYFWNLFFESFYNSTKTWIRFMIKRVFQRKS